ncbi:8417_t:CDS:1, partial [Entrophospora sp. SA101]
MSGSKRSSWILRNNPLYMIKIDLQFCPNNLCIPATSTPNEK